jgi:DNA-binding SARP family transcriptional activator
MPSAPAPAHSEIEARAPPGWRLHLLDQPRLARLDGSGTVAALSAKDAALLAIVALDGPVPAEHAASLLWPHADRRKSETNLRQRLFRLRRDLGARVVEGGATLRLADGVETDLGAALARIEADAQSGRDELLGAVAFEDLPDLARWLHGARDAWQARRRDALAEAAERCERSGALARALAYAQRLVDSDPLSEHAQRRLMRLHYLRGDRTAAIAAFEAFERLLKDELGARPSTETVELLATIERAAAALPTRRAVVPVGLIRPPRLIGRDGELAQLGSAWQQRAVFALFGEAGIGKTRLLHDFAATDSSPVTVRAQPGDAGIAYALLARLVRALLERPGATVPDERRPDLALLLPELGTPSAVAGDARRVLLERAAASTLVDAAHAGLGGIVVDDLHFADDASVAALQAVLAGEGAGGLDWGWAQRPAEGGEAARTLRAALEEERRLVTVTLGPLDEAQMEELVASLALPEVDAARLAPALQRHTGGNPLFALETLKAMLLEGGGDSGALPLPSGVGALVERRLAQLSPGALKLARAAALAGPSVSAALAAAVLEVHPLDLAEPWRELEAAQVIREGAFAHDLIHDAVRATVPEPIARLLHRRIAMHLQETGAAPAAVAPHWSGAQEWGLAAEAHARAARQARATSQRGHEVEHWRQAQACHERAGDTDRSFAARCESIQALIVVQGVARANDVIEALLADARTDRQRVEALIARANAALMAVDHATGIAATVEAAALARRLGDDERRREAERLQAVGLAQSGRPVEGLAIIEPLRAAIEAASDAEAKGRFWADYAYVLNTARRLRATADALDRAMANARELGDLAELATLTSNLATVKGNLGHIDEALALARQALALQAQLGSTDGPGGGVVETYAGLYCGATGRYAEALERLDGALERFRRDAQPLWIAVASNHKAQFLLELGQFARARQALEYEAPPVDSVRARGAAVAARIERALARRGDATLGRALALLERGGDPHVRMHALLDEAAVLEPPAAAARCADVMRSAGELEFGGVVLRAGFLRVEALHRGGESEKALNEVRDFVARLDHTHPVDMYLPEAWWIAVQVFDAAGAVDEALLALAHATRWIRQVALPHVPEPFRDSFLNRNPVNRRLLAAADRRLAGGRG